MKRPQPSGQERFFDPDEIIVSKTDLQGRLVYVNDVFCRVGLYREAEVLGQPHALVRHPDMPRAIFALLWQRIQQGEEIFAYVKNLARNGDHYWVLAHVTPSHDLDGAITGYHSNRRVPPRAALGSIEPLYRDLLRLEAAADRKAGLQASLAELQAHLARHGLGYDAYMLGLAVA